MSIGVAEAVYGSTLGRSTGTAATRVTMTVTLISIAARYTRSRMGDITEAWCGDLDPHETHHWSHHVRWYICMGVTPEDARWREQDEAEFDKYKEGWNGN